MESAIPSGCVRRSDSRGFADHGRPLFAVLCRHLTYVNTYILVIDIFVCLISRPLILGLTSIRVNWYQWLKPPIDRIKAQSLKLPTPHMDEIKPNILSLKLIVYYLHFNIYIHKIKESDKCWTKKTPVSGLWILILNVARDFEKIANCKYILIDYRYG